MSGNSSNLSNSTRKNVTAVAATTQELQRLLDSEEAGIFFGCTSRTVRNLHARGVLPAVHILGKGALRFRPETLIEIAKQLEMPATLSTEEEEIR